ncbi:AfsR/SARP family transcriptional regulator [Amycolatopsis panacis]|uniref:AfsR/SARP family transcriptional regulator n=1 Tax=Amycolatopsis panacis TaxID=2340917 RepID=UPI0013141838|nr:BTAD domain-containing putative transcriptional regulator [Amycolatopsis panacis]
MDVCREPSPFTRHASRSHGFSRGHSLPRAHSLPAGPRATRTLTGLRGIILSCQDLPWQVQPWRPVFPRSSERSGVAGSCVLHGAVEPWQGTGHDGSTAGPDAAIVAMPGLALDEATAMMRARGLDPSVEPGVHWRHAPTEAPRTVEIHALGIFRVTRNGTAVPRTAWQSRKARDLVKILVSRSRPVSRDQLMEMLWPDVDPGKSSNRLSVLLSTVRQVLQPFKDGPQPLLTDGTSVWLDANLVSIDVAQFRKTAARAIEAHRRGRPDAVDRMYRAAGLYTGDFLEDDPYADWAQHTVEELRALHQAVLRALIQHCQTCGDVDEVVRHTLRLFADDPYDEQAHLNLIKVLLTAGRIGEARRRHDIYRRYMTEIGVEPRTMPAFRPSAWATGERL